MVVRRSSPCSWLLHHLQHVLDHVAQRQRENALLRAIGASRRQVTVSMLVEASSSASSARSSASSSASLLGHAAAGGVLGARHRPPVERARAAAADDHPHARSSALLVTVLSALLPGAARPAAVPPVAAMRDVALERTGSPRSGRAHRGLALAGHRASCSIARRPRRRRAAALGPRHPADLSSPCSCSARSSPGRWPRPRPPLAADQGLTGTWPRRTPPATRSARPAPPPRCMVGVALVTGISVLAGVDQGVGPRHLRQAVHRRLRRQHGQLRLRRPQPAAVADQLNELPEVEAAAGDRRQLAHDRRQGAGR